MKNLDHEEFTDREWLGILSKEHNLSKERVIIVGNFQRTLRIKKEDWKKYFHDFGGIDFKQGKEIEITANGSGGSKAALPPWVGERLAAAPGDTYCVTEREGKYYLKKLDLIKRSTRVPGIAVIDSFACDVVRRSYAMLMDYQEITFDRCEQLLSLIGKFRYDPIAPLEKMSGKTGFLARKELLDKSTKADMEFVRDYKRKIIEAQLEDGSWENNTMITAFNLIKLKEIGAGIKDKAVEKGVKWLLSTTEPLGFPGLFMLSEKLTGRFNAWKEKHERGQGKSGRPHRRTTEKEKETYLEHRDVFSSVTALPCELRLTWTSGIVLEALLRCGLHREPRVVRAINTLLTISPAGNWCGCGYFDTRDINYVPDSSEPVDFNGVPVFKLQPREKIFAGIVCDNENCLALDIGQGRAFLSGRYRSTGECSMVVRKAMSFHPGYPGSNFEANAALMCSRYQGVIGSWGDVYLSTAFGLLTGTAHPLSAFLVLRSIPLLIRTQRSDGLWQENYTGDCPPPTKEESTLIILRTLKKFNFLETLLPH